MGPAGGEGWRTSYLPGSRVVMSPQQNCAFDALPYAPRPAFRTSRPTFVSIAGVISCVLFSSLSKARSTYAFMLSSSAALSAAGMICRPSSANEKRVVGLRTCPPIALRPAAPPPNPGPASKRRREGGAGRGRGGGGGLGG